jgi:alginate O-acetyltransferase complex protein AlgI
VLFNSYPFLFGFLPAVLLIYQFLSRFHRKAVVIWLGVASLIFYGYWKPAFLLVLGTSFLFNFFVSNLISRTIRNKISTRVLLWIAICGNLAALCWFKYLFPVLNFFSDRMRLGHHWGDVLLPLGISFFTFTQIAYMVDLQQGSATQQTFFDYLLFVTFFPHLIAGPILHHKDIMPQFQRDRDYGLRFNDLAVGFSWFAMGMCKKVLLADNLARGADAVFKVPGQPSPEIAWLGALSYVLQLYFDFSGYCDMACGLARMFSIDFPLNFASPLKSASIIEFWQRWHMTLTQYIGAYLYSPVQFWISARRQEKGKKVSRKAQATLEGFTQMVAFPTIFTMFIAGIWHGAGLQFLVFGTLHGVYLTVNHGWRAFRHRRGIEAPANVWARRVVHVGSVLLVFLSVMVGQLFFRAASCSDAMLMLERMVFLRGSANMPAADVGSMMNRIAEVVIGLIIIWAFPNTQQILARYKPALELAPADQKPRWLPIYWKPSLGWGLVLGGVLLVSVIELQNPSTFLYFQF